MVKAVLLDLDGTIIDSVGVLVKSFKEAFRKFGLDVDEEIIKGFIGMPRRVIAERILELCPGADVDSILKERQRVYEATWRSETRLVPEAILFIKMAKKKGLRVALVTSSNRARVSALLDYFGIGELFDCIVTADDVERGKPDPEPILKALECLGVELDEALFVGDSVYDEEAARRAGVRFFKVSKWEDFKKIGL